MTYAARHGRDADSPASTDRPTSQELVDAAQAWIDDDPDHETRVELGDVLAPRQGRRRRPPSPTSPTGSPACSSSAPPACAAPSAPGPNRMNRAVVIRAAAGLTAYLQASTARSRSSWWASTPAATPTSSPATPPPS